ncbi:hypothetical protein, partial [Priestia megaterium]|uniref:hypothetical protein n=1 Tax=Priestia megaterium TaxID=1404 RepID=UPI0035B57CDD
FYFSPYSGDGQKLAFLDSKGDLLGKFDCTSIFKPIDLSSLGISLVPVSKVVAELDREQEEIERRRELERKIWHEEFEERQRLLRQEEAELQVVRDIISKEFQVDRFNDVATSIGKLSA